MISTTPDVITKPRAAPLVDPITLLLSLLESGLPPAQCWPTRHEGLQAALHTSSGPPKPGSLTAERLMASVGGSPVSAIKVHASEKALLKAGTLAICNFEWLFDPTLAVIVTATREEQEKIQALIAREWRGEFVPPGMDPSSAHDVVLAGSLEGRRWQEVFIAPDCLALPGVELSDVVAAATLGLHTLPMPR